MPTVAERRNAAIRRILPETWDGRNDDRARMARKLLAIRAVLYPHVTQRDKIVEFVAGRRQARSAQIARHVGLHVSSIGGHLRALVAQGRLVNPERGVYAVSPAEAARRSGHGPAVGDRAASA